MAIAVRPPSPKRQPIMGHLMGFRRDPLNFLLDAARDYGDLVHFKFGPQEIFFINHPDAVRELHVSVQAEMRVVHGVAGPPLGSRSPST